MRISRPDYDKAHRCPGWSGGGMTRYATVRRCDGGYLHGDIYAGRWWRFRMNRCDTCDLLVLPYVVRYLDWRTWFLRWG
jgi:hypothetical protein